MTDLTFRRADQCLEPVAVRCVQFIHPTPCPSLLTLENLGSILPDQFPNYNWSPEGLVAVSGCYPFPYRH
jgi:hypothetical protein